MDGVTFTANLTHPRTRAEVEAVLASLAAKSQPDPHLIVTPWGSCPREAS